jgi:D-alanyl-D-alanine carboxypeptidase/D-alanyl-D-alanine-endopeptidase (penicillin-binding protein 4)
LTPIVVNDNVIDLVVTPADQVGRRAAVRMRPETSYVQIDAQVMTVEAGRGARIEIQAVAPQRLTVRGQIGLKSKPVVRIFPVADPAAFARALFIEVLGSEGVQVAASPLQPAEAKLPDPDAYGKLTRVAVFTSPPFSEVIKVTLKVSHNLYASTLPLLIAAKNDKKTLADGLRLQRQLLADLGVDVDALSFAGGAGGANADSVTPRATVQLLRAVARKPYYAAFKEALPVLGVDGTLAEAVPPDSPAKGKVQAKTGTLFWRDLLNDRDLLRSKALAGTLTTAKGRELVVVLFVNDVPLPQGVTPSREGKVLGRLCEIIYQHAPE